MSIVLPDNLPVVHLSTIQPDYVSIRDQLNQYLQTSAVWKDIIPASTGEILIKFVAGVGAYSQYSIERHVQECFFDTAKSPQNILTLARTLGVRIKRKSPARVTAIITRPNIVATYGIPQYTDFVINNRHFYNEDTITIPAGTASLEVNLVEGNPTVHNFTSSGQAWQKFYVGSGFRSSDSLVRVLVNDVEWESVGSSIWNADALYTGDPAPQFSESTTAAGRVEVTFGNGVVGSIPPSGANIKIIDYAVGGSLSNNAVSGLSGNTTFDTTLKLITTSPISGADDEPAASLYTRAGAKVGRSLGRYVSRSDYESNLIFYPNVVDIRVVGEHEVGTQLTMMNKVNVYTLLADDFSNAAEHDAFVDYVYQYSILGVVNQIIYSQSLPISVAGDLLVDPKYSLSDVYARVMGAISLLLAPQSGSIGRSVYRSDIHQAVMNVPGVVHFVLNSPTTDTIPLYSQWVSLDSLTINPIYYSSI